MRLENKAALKLIDKIISDLDKTGINTTTLLSDLKKLRAFALEAKIPLVVKTLRLTCEHIEENKSFLIPLPVDESFGEEPEAVVNHGNEPVDSLKYLILLIKNLHNKINVSELKVYRDLLNEA